MANHKSAITQYKRSVLREQRNKIMKTKVKNMIRKFESSLTSADFNNASLIFRETESQIMKACKSNVLKLNTAARKVSSMAKKLKSIDPSYQEYLKKTATN